VASWIRPTAEELRDGHPAGIPLDPADLQCVEDQDRFEADGFEFRFLTLKSRNDFRERYMEVKKVWDLKRQELEKTQGYTPVNRRTNNYPNPDPSNARAVPKPIHNARFSHQFSALTEMRESESKPMTDKGKGKAPHCKRISRRSEKHCVRDETSTARRGTNSISSEREEERLQYRGGYGRRLGSGLLAHELGTK
jgi:hypothetical protein